MKNIFQKWYTPVVALFIGVCGSLVAAWASDHNSLWYSFPICLWAMFFTVGAFMVLIGCAVQYLEDSGF